MTEQIIENYLKDSLASFRNYKKMAERAMVQVSDEEFFRTLDAEANSIAVIVKHIAGNQKSRWTDFLTSDGEKDFRRRDTEFELIGDTRESLMEFWETGWQTLFSAIEPLTNGRFFALYYDSRRTAYDCRSNQSSIDALRLSRRADHVSGKTFSFRRLENFERSAQ